MPAGRPPVPTVWRNRIVASAEVLARELVPNEANWRLHPEPQKRALRGALAEVVWVQNIIVNRRTGRIVDGHLRAELAASQNEIVPVVYVDLSEDEERLVLASIDPLSSMAIADEDKLAELLTEIKTDNKDLALLFGQLKETGIQFDDDEASGENKSGARPLGDQEQAITAVIYAPQVAIFEKALRLTGQANRGAALMAICQSYIEREGQEGQFNFRAESTAARARLT